MYANNSKLLYGISEKNAMDYFISFR